MLLGPDPLVAKAARAEADHGADLVQLEREGRQRVDRAVNERLEAHLPDGDPLARVEHIREPLAEAGDTPVDAAIVRESVEFDAHSRVIVGGAPEQRHGLVGTTGARSSIRL